MASPLSTAYPIPATLGNRGEITALLKYVPIRKLKRSPLYIDLLFYFGALEYNLDIWRKL